MSMLRVGLTGSIATGKSTVLEMLAESGVPVFSSDAAVHALYRGAAVAPLERLFPGIAVDGAIDRTELARRLLAAPGRLSEVEAIVHPLVRGQIAEFFAGAERQGAALAVADIPLLFENGFDHGLDAVVVTVVDEATQRRRALQRPGMTVEKLDALLARQMPQAEKQARADYVIDTSQPLQVTRGKVAALLEALRARSQEEP